MEIKSTTQQPNIELNYDGILNQQVNSHFHESGENINIPIQCCSEIPLEEKEVKKSVDKLNKLLEGKETYVEYEVYGKFKDITIKIINKKTKQTVKEIPPRKIIDMVAKLCELAGFFIDEKV